MLTSAWSRLYRLPPVWFLPLVLLVVTLFSAYSIDPNFFKLNIGQYSIHDGIRYYSRLSLWHYYVHRSNWPQANHLSAGLDPVDTAATLSLFSPESIAKRLNIMQKSGTKTANDYLEIAQLQTRLGKTRDALKSLEAALSVDPLRDDIRSLYRQLAAQ